MKLWQDKTDEEFKKDIMAMVKEGKLFVHNPWDHIKTLEEAKDYVEAIYEEMDSEMDAANDCIIEILESYMELINIFEQTMKAQGVNQNIKAMALTLCQKRKNDWQPILNEARKKQEAWISAK